MASAVERDETVEYEMSTHQRGLVDTCLEEGQFESAVALLEQLRSPSHKPAISHIRQLIYIALQPEHPPSIHEIVIADVPSSPSKATLKKRIPSGTAVLAARRLLNSFAITNSPEAIGAALPFYGDPRKDESVIRAGDDGSLESVIGPQSMCISRAKSCWSILAQGYTQRGHTFSMSSDNGRKRSHNLNEDDTVNDFENTIVGGDAWSTLDWLILLFEQDEMLAESRASGRFSNLLLQQIPPPRSGTGSRWDTAIPLRIILFCMEQTNIRRQMLGSRLMTLFINLSATPHLDLSMFVASLYSHLNAAGLEKLPALLSNLYPSTSTYRFKIMLCRKLLSDASHEQVRDGQTRVQARARALRATRTEESINSHFGETSASSQAAKSLIPSCVEIMRCLETRASSSFMTMTQPVLLRVKFELINSYGLLQSELTAEERDSDWMSLLRDGKANKLIETVFSFDNPDSHIFREVLQSTMLIWSS
ncbi:hypothetical protein H2248_004685 [Termitomyces sp. 'cryptogamus']|nr:hypothetical protein H2248_004685 [Termitomyces sp. 'cryptogamus']